MSSSVRQLPLDLPGVPPRYTRDAFLRADANESAWRAGESWLKTGLKSGDAALVVCGPASAGKTHFAHALIEGLGFALLSADAFAFSGVPSGAPSDALNAAPKGEILIIDDMPAGDPQAFLAAFETGVTAGRRFILVGEGHPSLWSMGLKDLRTRLEAAPRAMLSDPDETLIRAVIAKGFRDRQVSVSPSVIEYAAPRLPRTFAAARAFVALADRAALEEKRKITTPFVQKLIDNLSEGDPAA